MPQHYEHISSVEREYIALRRRQGVSLREIARELGRHVSTISREVRRNRDTRGRYYSRHANRLAEERCHKARKPKKLRAKKICREVERDLAKCWSPDQVSGRRSYEGLDPVSKLTIYRYMEEHPELKKYLRRPKSRRGKKRDRIHDRVMIDERPEVVGKRSRVGDWESDTICGAQRSGACVATHVERKSYYLVMGLLKRKNSEQMNQVTSRRMKSLPVKTLTVDNGMEFGSFKKLEKKLGAKVYFAQEKKPWQRARVELTNGLVRQFFPKGTDFSEVSPAQLRRAEKLLNERPRKALGYRTPKEAMQDLGVALAI